MRKSGFFPRLALVNLMRNGRFYGPYLLSCGMTAAMYYILSYLTFSDIVASVRGAGYLQSLMYLGRCAVLLQEDDTVCEMALDEGELRHNGKSAPLCEIELEYVAGSEDTFHALAAELAQQLDLVVEPTSKLARAMAL